MQSTQGMIGKISLAFTIASKDDALTVGEDFTVKRLPEKRANTKIVYRKIEEIVVRAILDKETPPGPILSSLRESIINYADKRFLPPNGNRSLFPDYVKRVECVIDLLMIKKFLKDDNCHLVREQDAPVVDDLASGSMLASNLLFALHNSIHRYIQCSSESVYDAVAAPKALDEVWKGLSDALVAKADWMLTNHEFQFLKKIVFPTAFAKWRCDRGVAKNSDGFDWDLSSRYGEHLLQDVPEKVSDIDFDVLSHPRDVLFIEKLLIKNLYALLLAHEESLRIAVGWLEDGLAIEMVGENSAVIRPHLVDVDISSFDLSDDVDNTVRKIRGAKSDESLVHSLKKIAPKLQALPDDESPAGRAKKMWIEQLEQAELNFRIRMLESDWKALDFSAEALTEGDVQRYFEKESYLVRKRLSFFMRIGRVVNSVIHKDACSGLQEHLREERKLIDFVFPFFRDVVSAVPLHESASVYEKLHNTISRLIQLDKRSSRTQNMRYCLQIAFTSGEGVEEDDDNYECYEWKKIDPDEYRRMLSQLERVEQTTPLKTREVICGYRAASNVALNVEGNQEQVNDFLSISPPRRKALPKRASSVKKKARSREQKDDLQNSRGVAAKAEQQAKEQQDDMNADLETRMGNLSLQEGESRQVQAIPSRVSQHPAKISPLHLPNVYLVYHQRVTRWFRRPGSNKDPFVSDPEYTIISNPLDKKRIQRCHGFTTLVDRYLPWGVELADKKTLKSENIKSRTLLFGTMKTSDAGVEKVVMGIFTYTVNLKGICYHRHFSKKFDTVKSSPVTKQALKALGNLKISKEKLSVVPALTQRDGSMVLLERDDYCVIEDAKNEICITLVNAKAMQK